VGKYQGYEKYKSSGVEWLGEIPEHWEFKKLKNITSCNDETLGENTSSDYEIEYVDISSVDLISGITHYENMTFDKAPSRARRKARDGDTIISTARTYLKSIAAIKEPPTNLIVSTGFEVIRPRDNINSDYIAYLLQTEGFIGDVVSNSVGVSYPAINSTVLISLPVVKPPLEEQRSIAHFLDRKTTQIDTLIAKKAALLEKLDEKRTALISHAVTKGLDPTVPMKDSGVEWLGDIPEHWEVKRLRFLATMSGGSTPNKNNPDFWDGEIPWISAKDMKTERLKFSIDKITDLALKETSVHIHPRNGIVIVVRGMILAHSFPVAVNDIDTTINQDLKVLRTSQNTDFLAILLRGIKNIVLSIMEESGHGTKVLRTDLFRNVSLPNPPEIEQSAIVDYVNQKTAEIDRQKDKIKEAIELLKEYRTALITNAVTGKIDVRQVANV
jgi:type I restriction enzyme, S subunit